VKIILELGEESECREGLGEESKWALMNFGGEGVRTTELIPEP